MADDAGALLVRSGLISEEQLLIARQAQAGRGGTLGEHLVLAGFIEDNKLAEFYRTRLMVPQVSPKQLTGLSKKLIDLIPSDMANEFRCIPIRLDKDGNLTLAMADPSTTHTVDEIAFFTRHYVVRVVATQGQIAWCLATYYQTLSPMGQKLARYPSAESFLPGPMPPPETLRAAGAQSGPVPHVRNKPSITSQVQASRHRVLPPVTKQPMRGTPGAPEGPVQSGDTERVVARTPPGVSVGEVESGKTASPSGPVPVAIEPEPEGPPHRPSFVPPSRNQRVISFLHEETSPTGPMRTLETKREVQPPELYDRAGEVDVPTGPIQILEDHLPSVVVSMPRGTDSQPILLDRLRPPEQRPLPLPGSGSKDGPTDGTPEAAITGAFDATLKAASPKAPKDTVPDVPRDTVPDVPRDTVPDAPIPDASDDTVSDKATDDADGEPTAANGSEDDADGVVLLDRPKGNTGPTRRRLKNTRIGLGISPSLISQLSGSARAQLADGDEPYIELKTEDQASAQRDKRDAELARSLLGDTPGPSQDQQNIGATEGPHSSGPKTSAREQGDTPSSNDASADAKTTESSQENGLEAPRSTLLMHSIIKPAPPPIEKKPERRASEAQAKARDDQGDELEKPRKTLLMHGGAPASSGDESPSEASGPVSSEAAPGAGPEAASEAEPNEAKALASKAPPRPRPGVTRGVVTDLDDSGTGPEDAFGGVVATETIDQPTMQMNGAPTPYPSSWRGLDAADSIASAAEAAAEAQAKARATRDSRQAIPMPILDEPPPDSEFDEEPTTGQFQRETLSETDDEDDEWGPPGSTIPPPYLGAVTEVENADSGPGRIPIFTDHLTEEDAIDVTVKALAKDAATEADNDGSSEARAGDDELAEPIRPDSEGGEAASQSDAGPAANGAGEPARAKDESTHEDGPEAAGPEAEPPLRHDSNVDIMTPETARELEDSSLRLVEILRELDQVSTRDQVVEILTAHLAESYRRVAFFAVKSGQLSIWKKRSDDDSEGDDDAILTLDKPSTFQDIVGTRLPYRGPLADPASHHFIAKTFGNPAKQMLGLPVAVRGRVVGVLYGDGNHRRMFKEHLAVVTRAAGVAFERILKIKKQK